MDSNLQDIVRKSKANYKKRYGSLLKTKNHVSTYVAIKSFEFFNSMNVKIFLLLLTRPELSFLGP